MSSACPACIPASVGKSDIEKMKQDGNCKILDDTRDPVPSAIQSCILPLLPSNVSGNDSYDRCE